MENNKTKLRPNPNLTLTDQVREVLRYDCSVYRTEQTCCQWILRYIHYFGGINHAGQKISRALRSADWPWAIRQSFAPSIRIPELELTTRG